MKRKKNEIIETRLKCLCAKDVFSNSKILFCICTAVFFSLHHYVGFVNDGSLYLLQAVHYLDPTRFVDDVPFIAQNQDDFTIFSPIFAFALKLFGISLGGKLFCFSLQFLFCISFCFVARSIARIIGHERSAIFMVIAFFLYYAHAIFFGAGIGLWVIENTSVARLLAQGIVFLGFVFFWDKWKYVSLLLFFIAMFTHPLVAGWALPIWFFYHCPKLRIPILCVGILSPLTVLLQRAPFISYSQLGIVPPFSVMDVEYREYVGFISIYVTLSFLIENSAMRKFSRCILITMLIAVYLQVIGYLTENVFFYQVQPNRIKWICMAFAFPLIICFAQERIRRISDERLIVWGDVGFAILCYCIFVGLNIWGTLFSCVLSFIHKKVKWVFLDRYLKSFVFCYAITLFLRILTQNMDNLYLEGVYSNELAYRLFHDLNLVFEAVFKFLAFMMMSYLLLRKRFSCAAVYFVALVKSNFIFTPVLGFALLTAPLARKIHNKKNVWILGVVLLDLVLFNSFWSGESSIAILLLVLFLLVELTKKTRALNFLVLILAFVLALVYDIVNWDSRLNDQLNAEKQMDVFLERPIFDKVNNWGRTIVSVSGFFYDNPRAQFLVGTYYDKTSHSGEIFNDQLSREVLRRQNLLDKECEKKGFKSNCVYNDGFASYKVFVDLCQLGEVNYLLSDMVFADGHLVDDRQLRVLKKNVYLYGCPN